MTTETLLVTLVATLLVVYAIVALTAYLRAQWSRLVLPGAGDALPAAAHVDIRGMMDHVASRSAAARATDSLRRWFAGKSCAICSRPIAPVHRIEQHPGVVNVTDRTHDLIAWEEIPRDERLAGLLESHLPVCANCMIAETLRRQYPERVVDRPDHAPHPTDVH